MRRGAQPRGAPSGKTPSLSIGSGSALHRSKGRISRRPTLACLFLGSILILVIYYFWIVVSRLDLQTQNLSVMTIAPANQQKASSNQNASLPSGPPIRAEASIEPMTVKSDLDQDCKHLSIYPPHLLSNATATTLPLDIQEKLCARIFYPLDFAEQQAPKGYNWKATGYQYFATGIGLHHVTFDEDLADMRNHSRHNLIYNSMMKCGSSSVNRALKELPKATLEYFSNHGTTTPMEVVYQGNKNNLMAGPSENMMRSLFQYQQHQQQEGNAIFSKNETFQYFTTVRDPVKRFVSAVAQEMFIHHGKDQKAKGFRTKCLKESPQETLACSIRHVQDRFSGEAPLNQPHFVPMTTVLYRRSYGFNTSVLLFDMHQVSSIISLMVAPSRQGEFEKVKNKLKPQGSEVLKNMTVSHLSTDMISQICKLYEMDVRLMALAGFPTLCRS